MYEKYLSQLAHVAIATPKIEASLYFYKEILGMYESGRDSTGAPSSTTRPSSLAVA